MIAPIKAPYDDPVRTLNVIEIDSGADFHSLEPGQYDYYIIRHDHGGATFISAPGGRLTSLEVFASVDDAINALRAIAETEVCGDGS